MKKAEKQSSNSPKSKIKKFMPLIKFFGIFIGVIALYYIVLITFNESIFNWYIQLTANLSGALINLLGGEVVVEGIRIISDTFVIFLSFGCEGSEAIMIFLAGVLAFPAALKKKLIGLVAGGLFLYFMNLFRIVILFYIGRFKIGSFDAFHNEILPIFFIIFSLLIWGIWIKWATKEKKA
jgi:exosortase/archaeosortase family protein